MTKYFSQRSLLFALTTVSLLAGVILVGSGCGKEKNPSAEKPPPTSSAQCPATMDITAWQAFQNLGDQLIAGQPATADQVQSYSNLPVIVQYRESIVGANVTSAKMGSWVEAAFWEECGQGRPAKQTGNRRSYGQGFRINYDHRQAIDLALADYERDGHPCRTYELASKWLQTEKIPEPFTINFLAGKAELRSHYGTIMVDTSLLLAGGPEQLDRQIVSVMYRERQALDGPSPTEVEGVEAVAHIFRVMMNEGVATWIGQLAETEFNDIHPKLAQVDVIPEEIFKSGVRGMDIFNTNLPAMLADPAAMTKRGQALGRSILGAGAYTNGGYSMAAVIVQRLGESKLQEVRLSPPQFIRAYQEAAGQNSLPLPYPGKEGTELHESMPSFSDEVFTGLMAILEETFPTPH